MKIFMQFASYQFYQPHVHVMGYRSINKKYHLERTIFICPIFTVTKNSEVNFKFPNCFSEQFCATPLYLVVCMSLPPGTCRVTVPPGPRLHRARCRRRRGALLARRAPLVVFGPLPTYDYTNHF